VNHANGMEHSYQHEMCFEEATDAHEGMLQVPSEHLLLSDGISYSLLL
jgi:hypothetical protein